MSLEGDAGQGVNGLCGNLGLRDQYRDPFSGQQIVGMCRQSADMDHQACALGFNGEWDHRDEWRTVVVHRAKRSHALTV